jgi:hypothetical protein
VEAIVAAARDFAGGRMDADDTTVVVLRRTG